MRVGGEAEEAVARTGAGAVARARGPSLDLVSCSPGQQLEGRRKGGEATGEDSIETSGGEFLSEERKVRKRWRWKGKSNTVREGVRVVLEVWKEDSGKAIRFL